MNCPGIGRSSITRDGANSRNSRSEKEYKGRGRTVYLNDSQSRNTVQRAMGTGAETEHLEGMEEIDDAGLYHSPDGCITVYNCAM
eukprot:96140-Hanusia_phi.AAC.1